MPPTDVAAFAAALPEVELHLQVVTVAGPALDVADGYFIIPATVVLGLSFAYAGVDVLRRDPRA